MLNEQTEELLDKLIRLRVRVRILEHGIELFSAGALISDELRMQVEANSAELRAAIGPQAGANGSLIPIVGGRKPVIYAIHAAQGSVSEYRYAAKRLNPRHAFYGFQQVPGDTEPTLRQLAEKYVSILLAHTRNDPYVLYGGSSGGIVAIAMTRILLQRGHPPCLAIFGDTFDPWCNTLTHAGALTHYGWISFLDAHCSRWWLALVPRDSPFWGLDDDEKLDWIFARKRGRFTAPWSTSEELRTIHANFVSYWQDLQSFQPAPIGCRALYMQASRSRPATSMLIRTALEQGGMTVAPIVGDHTDLLRPSGADAVAAAISQAIGQLD